MQLLNLSYFYKMPDNCKENTYGMHSLKRRLLLRQLSFKIATIIRKQQNATFYPALCIHLNICFGQGGNIKIA